MHLNGEPEKFQRILSELKRFIHFMLKCAVHHLMLFKKIYRCLHIADGSISERNTSPH